MRKVSPTRIGSLKLKLIRLFRGAKTFTVSENDMNINIALNPSSETYHNFEKEFNAAMMMADRKRAEALEWQRRRFIS